MNQIIIEIAIVIALIFLNGFFSGTEMALIVLRKTRIKQLVQEGNKNAKLIEKLQNDPEKFLATIQVGITLINVIASAFAGATIAEALTPFVRQIPLPLIANHAETLSFIIIVMAMTYISLIFGELVPKSLGIKFSEKFALFSARPIYFLSQITFVFTKFLTGSSNLILKFFGDKTSFSEAKLTEDEVRSILYESHKSGVIKKYEHEMLNNVFEFSDMATSQIMTPRSKIFSIDAEDSFEENLKKIVKSGYSRIPVYKEKIDNVIGILNTKDLLQKCTPRQVKKIDLSSMVKPPLFVPNTQKIGSLLRKFQKGKIQMALVSDEYGDLDGLITLEDILEEIVGEISDESDEENTFIRKQKDGSYLVEGSTSVVDFNKFFLTSIPETEQYNTISGLLLDKFEKFPNVGDSTLIEGTEFTIKAKTDRLIKLVEVKKGK